MVLTHDRPTSPGEDEENPTLLKRMKMSHISPNPTAASSDPTPHFAPDVLQPNMIHRLHVEYAENGPYHYAVVDKLFRDDLLLGVKDECLSELSFTEKETDIYKVRRSHA